jgi:hypothetical protein
MALPFDRPHFHVVITIGIPIRLYLNGNPAKARRIYAVIVHLHARHIVAALRTFSTCTASSNSIIALSSTGSHINPAKLRRLRAF